MVFTPVVYITGTAAAQIMHSDAMKKSSGTDSLPNQRDLYNAKMLINQCLWNL